MVARTKAASAGFTERTQSRIRKSGGAQNLGKTLKALQKGGAIVIRGVTEEIIVLPDLDESAFRPDARARALLRGVEIARQDLADAGGAYSLEQVQVLMNGITRQAVEKRVQEGSLLAVPGPSNRRHYPAAQFNSDGSPIRGLKDVQEALPSRNPWFVLNFLVNPDTRLNRHRPLDMLKDGKVEAVVEAARSIGVQGA